MQKKEEVVASVGISPMGATTIPGEPSVTKARLSKPTVEEYSGSKELPAPLGRDVVLRLKKDPYWVWSLKVVVRQNPRVKKIFDVRVFSDYAAAVKKVKVRRYASLDEHPELILFEGWFDKASN